MPAQSLEQLDTPQQEALAELATAIVESDDIEVADLTQQPSMTRRTLLQTLGGVGVGAALGGGAATQVIQPADADPQGELGDSADPWTKYWVNELESGSGASAINIPDGVNVDELNSVPRVTDDWDESTFRTAVGNASFGDRIIFEPGTSITLTSTLTVPAGVMFDGSTKQRNAEDATIKKGFDGTLIQYNDWFTCRNINFGGDRGNWTGDGLVPQSSGNRELRFDDVQIRDFEGDGFVMEETFLSTFVGVDFHNNGGAGIRHVGTAHSPHNLFARCNIQDNDTAGIKLDYYLDRNSFVKCYIHQNNGPGIDVSDASSGIGWQSFLSGGTTIQENDGPGLLADDHTINLDSDPSVEIWGNVQNPDSSLTTPVGEIHSESGSQIQGRCYATLGDIQNHGSAPVHYATFGGGIGTVADADMNAVVLNAEEAGDISGVNSAAQLDPTSGGQLIDKDGNEIY